MKRNLLFSIMLTLSVFWQCTNPQSSNSTVQEPSNVAEPKDRDANYYRSKGFQIFPQYHLAIKCPVLLADISSKTKANFDFHYGGIENNENFYEVIVIDLPLGYRDLSQEEKAKFEQEFLSNKFSGKSVVTVMEGKEINAKVMEYTHDRGQGRGLAFILDGKTFAFNVIASNNIDAKFNSLTNNIIFYQVPMEQRNVTDSKSPIQKHSETTLPPSQNNQIKASEKKKESSITESSVEQNKSKNIDICVNCDKFDLKFRNYKWGHKYSEDLCLESFSILNLSSKTLWSVNVKWTVYDSDGTPNNSGHFDRDVLDIEPNSAKMAYDVCFLSKERSSQKVKLEIVSVKYRDDK